MRATELTSIRRARLLAGASALLVVALIATAGTARSVDAQPATSSYHPLDPCRLTDTRVDAPGRRAVDMSIQVVGRCGVPTGASAVFVAVVATDAQLSGYLTLIDPDTGTGQTMSVTNYRPGQTRSNTTTATLSSSGGIGVRSTGSSDVIVDVLGYFLPATIATAGRLVAVTPRRLVDTRDGHAGMVAPSGDVAVALPADVPPDAVALAVNLTVVSRSAGFLGVRASGRPWDGTSVLNYGSHDTRAGATFVPVDGGGFAVRVGAGATHVIVDFLGYITGPSAPASGDGLYLSQPRRALDTREAGRGIHPNGAIEVAMQPGGAALVNITMIASERGWIRATPAGVGASGTSSVNGGLAYDDITANLAVVALSDRGIELTSLRASDVVVDVLGTFTGTPHPATLPPLGNHPTARTPFGYPVNHCDLLGAPSLAGDERQMTGSAIIGLSVRGRPIRAEHYGPTAPYAPQVIVVSGIHGNECAPNFVADAIRRRPPTEVGIWVIPVLNPDGYEAGWRFNARGIDLNADGYTRRQPETRALLAFVAEVAPVLTVHVHSPNGFVGGYNGPLAQAVAEHIAFDSGLRLGRSAGWRDAPDWFLWQGEQAVLPGTQTVLVELTAIDAREATNATPRPGPYSIERVRAEADAVVSALTTLIR